MQVLLSNEFEIHVCRFIKLVITSFHIIFDISIRVLDNDIIDIQGL